MEQKKYSPTLVPATNQKCQELKTSISNDTHPSQFRAWSFYKVSFQSFARDREGTVERKERYKEETLSRLIEDLGKVASLA